MRFGQLLAGLVPILAPFFLAGEAALQGLEFLFREAHVAGVLHRVAIRIGAIGSQAHIDPGLLASWNMLDSPLGFHTGLDVVAICSSDEAHPLDLVDRKSSDGLFFV